MMRWLAVLASIAALTGCAEQEANPQKEKAPIIRNLPNQDREFLLEPLEAALDDIREIVDNDPALSDSTIEINNGLKEGTIHLRLNGTDTVKLVSEWSSPVRTEKHLRYWDENGELFFMQSHYATRGADSSMVERRAYRVYLEEGGQVISTYGKSAYGNRALPDEWRSICPTPEELNHLLQILRT